MEDVYIYNLTTKDTIEEKILYVLYKKLGLLKDVIGEMENILRSDSNNIDSEIINYIYENHSGNSKVN